jgi:hypothetical protein
MNNIRQPYAERNHRQYTEGVHRFNLDWIVYISKQLKGHTTPCIVADRKFKDKGAAEIYYKSIKEKEL